MMMVETMRRACAKRAGWYVDRIDDLVRYMRERPQLDGDDVQQCQSMLREILARFRMDKRPTANGEIIPASMRECVAVIAEAGALLRVTASTRPTSRWRDELAICRAKMAGYLSRLPQE